MAKKGKKKNKSTKNRTKEVRWALVGYGGAFNMGQAHGNSINKQQGMQVVAVCDLDESRFPTAQENFPGIQTYSDIDEMVKDGKIDGAVIITPHNTHAKLALKCLKAGKHVVVEKPFCITVKEATEMIDAAKKAKVMLSVFHNRRQDGDYKAIQKIVKKGLIGEIFQLELCMGGYGHPGTWWRSNKEISGGAFYDWGAHIVDWVLNLIPSKMEKVIGFSEKRVWHDVTNEDHVHAVLKFANGAVADFQLSNIARIGKPRWRVLGDKGAFVHEGNKIRVASQVAGLPTEMLVDFAESDWDHYYKNIADHLLRGKELEVKPEEARRVIAVLEYAERSWKSGKPEKLPFE